MLPPIPSLNDYDISANHGFLPGDPPLERLAHPYYAKWETIITTFQSLLLSKRLRTVLERLPIVSTAHLQAEGEWRRAYSVLAFMAHGYTWGGDKPAEVLPPPITVPLLAVSAHLQIPPVATYAGLCLWNWKPIFPDEDIDNLENLSTLSTFTGSLDEQWFYLVSVAIEARGGPTVPIMLNAIAAARLGDTDMVIRCLHHTAERLDEVGSLLVRMYENCDPHMFYHRIRPFLAGGKNMHEAGLPKGILYADGKGTGTWRQYGGGSNAQSSLIQFFDIVLGIEHRPTGEKRSAQSSSEYDSESGHAPAPLHNFIHQMRSYMPGPHRKFLHDVEAVANIREYVESRRHNRALCVAYDACLAMLRALRDKHIQMVSRYIIVKSRESRSHSRSISPRAAPQAINLATVKSRSSANDARGSSKKLRGTGGTALIPFLKQARDETGEPAIDAWARRLLSNGPGPGEEGASEYAELGKVGEHADGQLEIVGLAGTWKMDDSEGGLCHW